MTHRLMRASSASPSWPNFTGTDRYVGTSQSGLVSVYVDAAIAPAGVQNATDLLADADRVVQQNTQIFGTPPGSVNVIVFALGGKVDGTGGADHRACDFTNGRDIEVCASFGSPMRVSALFEAEYSECSMGGNLCGANTGEALSRWCAAVVSKNALGDFASAPAWAKAGMPDYVTRTDQTDQNDTSTGCGMAFLSWLQKLGHPLSEIAPAMVALGTAGVLAQLYARLTGDAATNAYPKFLAAAKALPTFISDDPFGTQFGAHPAAMILTARKAKAPAKRATKSAARRTPPKAARATKATSRTR